MSACVLWFGEEEGHSLAHRGTDYYLVREESCAEQDVPHIVLCYAVSPLRSFLFTPLPFRLYPFFIDVLSLNDSISVLPFCMLQEDWPLQYA